MGQRKQRKTNKIINLFPRKKRANLKDRQKIFNGKDHKKCRPKIFKKKRKI